MIAMDNIFLTKEDRIAVLKISRPGSKNALDGKSYDEFREAMEDLKGDPETRALIITGVDNAFCAGIDLAYANELRQLGQTAFMSMMKRVQSTFRFERLRIPVIAAVNGYALGNGCDIALACDFIYAAQSAVFSMAYTNIAMVPDLGGTFRLTKLVGPSIAKELILTGEKFDAKKGHELGIVNKVVPDNALMKEVMNFAGKLAQRAPIALAMAKKAINNSLSNDLESILDFEAYNQSLCMKSEDSREALDAMLQKRQPVFSGK
jgi:enoyl-CoA hydratase/carnithine racemase